MERDCGMRGDIWRYQYCQSCVEFAATGGHDPINSIMASSRDDHMASGGPSDVSGKILDVGALGAAIEAARLAGKTVVHCHGCFDLVHPGHVRYFQFARQQGDVLVVSLTGDSLIDKGPVRPYIPQELRAESVAALQFVDYVTIDPHPTAAELIQAIQPDVYVKGHEYQTSVDPGFARERQAVESYGGRVIYSSGEVVFSSTQLIERIGRSAQVELAKLVVFCDRHQITSGLLVDLLQQAASLRVVVIGDTILDKYVLCDAKDLASESPMVSLTRLGEHTYWGGAAIVAQHLAELGASTCLVTAAGADTHSADLADTLVRVGIDHHIFPARREIVTKSRFLVDDTKLFKVDDGHPQPLDSRTEREAARVIVDELVHADAVIWCDFGYGMVTDGLWSRVAGEVRRRVGVVTADVSGSRGNLLRFANANLLCPTERELRSAMNDFESGLSKVAFECLRRTQAQQLLVTLDKRGLVVFDRPSHDASSPAWSDRLLSEHLPSMADRAVDKLGCGDALLAGATLGLAAGATLAQATYMGAAVAAIEIDRVGNIAIDAASLVDWLSGRSELVQPVPADRPRRTPPAVLADMWLR